MNLDLTNKTALVCGASQGMGAACAKQLAGQGCKVIALARNEEKLKNLVQQLNQKTQIKHEYLAMDLSNLELLQEKITHIINNQPIQILINNSGGPKPGALMTATLNQFSESLSQHLYASQVLAQLLVPGMKKSIYGRIINIISISVKSPIPYLGVSNTTRWAVTAWVKTLSKEIAQFGITANCILPGYTRTERYFEWLEAMSAEKGIPQEEIEKEWLVTIPSQRLGEPEDIANAVGFLASPAASYINGAALVVDGGITGCI